MTSSQQSEGTSENKDADWWLGILNDCSDDVVSASKYVWQDTLAVTTHTSTSRLANWQQQLFSSASANQEEESFFSPENWVPAKIQKTEGRNLNSLLAFYVIDHVKCHVGSTSTETRLGGRYTEYSALFLIFCPLGLLQITQSSSTASRMIIKHLFKTGWIQNDYNLHERSSCVCIPSYSLFISCYCIFRKKTNPSYCDKSLLGNKKLFRVVVLYCVSYLGVPNKLAWV